MNISCYSSADFADLARAAQRMGVTALCHQPFVDWYYTGSDNCRLWLMTDNAREIVGVIGVDSSPFEYDGEQIRIGFGSNFHSLQKGAGGLLYLRWLKSAPLAAVFGGTEMTHAITRSQKWKYFGGIKTYFLNRGLAPHAGEPLKSRFLKSALKTFSTPVVLQSLLERLPREAGLRLSVREEDQIELDMLPTVSAFRFRCAPDVGYLRWRYNTRLSFARYRVFRLLTDDRTTGYVITHETSKRVSIAQADGEIADDLAYGIIIAASNVIANDTHTREVLLSSSHPSMQHIFTNFGFCAARSERPFALGSLRLPILIDADTSNWLVNFDWTDNCLRAPFPNWSRKTS